MKVAHIIAFVLTIIGGLNWLLVGLFKIDLVMSLLGQWDPADRIVYILVGLSAVYLLVTHKMDCKMCSEKM